MLQKKMNDIYTNGKLTTGLPPIHIQPPSMGSVLDMLNAINGIIFVQVRYVTGAPSSLNFSQCLSFFSPKDIANLKNVIEKRQLEEISENGEEVKEGASELPKDEPVAKAPAAVQS